MRQFYHTISTTRHLGFPLLLALSLTACSGDSTSSTTNSMWTTSNLTDSASSTFDDLLSAAFTPLHDFNIIQDKIPEALQTVADNPYKSQEFKQCETIRAEMAQLNAVLGADVDAPPKAALSMVDTAAAEGGNMLHDAAVGFVRSQTNILPVRDIVRQISGAKAHDKKVAKATEAGKLRRAYLHGVADGKFGAKCSFGPISITADSNKTKSTSPIASLLEVADDL